MRSKRQIAKGPSQGPPATAPTGAGMAGPVVLHHPRNVVPLRFVLISMVLAIGLGESRIVGGQSSAPPDRVVYPYPEYVPPTWRAAPPATVVYPTLGITPHSAYGPGGPQYRPDLQRQQTFYRWQRPALLPGAPIDVQPADVAPSITYPQPLVPGAQPHPGTMPLPPLASAPGAAVPQGMQPLIRFQNLPPGVYTGQGVLGQPKAYVDGQPARNLLRYLSPW